MSGAGRAPWLAILMLFCAAAQGQENPYVYVKMPLTVPWTLYFVFLGAVLIPFVVMIVLAWRKQPRERGRGRQHAAPGPAGNGRLKGAAMDRFVRVGLPLVLVVVFAVIALFVLNAFEATDLMEAERRAGPTLLNR